MSRFFGLAKRGNHYAHLLLTGVTCVILLACRDPLNHVIKVSSKEIKLSRVSWKAVEGDSASEAQEFQERAIRPGHCGPTSVTIHKFPPSDNAAYAGSTPGYTWGEKITRTEWVRFWILEPTCGPSSKTITVMLNMNKGSYWLHSEDTFPAEAVTGIRLPPLGMFLVGSDADKTWQQLEQKLEPTRVLLNTVF